VIEKAQEVSRNQSLVLYLSIYREVGEKAKETKKMNGRRKWQDEAIWKAHEKVRERPDGGSNNLNPQKARGSSSSRVGYD
jgi:hypothetical protein